MNRIFQARFHFFKSLPALDGAFGIIEYFEIDQPADFIFLGKAFRLFQAMLSHATDKVVGHADVKRASDAAGEDINAVTACPHQASGYRVARSSWAMTAVAVAPSLAPSSSSPRTSRGRDERSSLLEGRGEGRFDPRILYEGCSVPCPSPGFRAELETRPLSPRRAGRGKSGYSPACSLRASGNSSGVPGLTMRGVSAGASVLLKSSSSIRPARFSILSAEIRICLMSSLAWLKWFCSLSTRSRNRP